MPSGPALAEFLAGHDSMAVVCHNNPDPDSLASAMALELIARDVEIDDVDVLYSGTISHQQNRAFVNLLDLDLTRFSVENVDGADLVAFVDHSLPGANNEVPEGTAVDIVIDHHSTEGVDAAYVDHRADIGATATIMTEYLSDLDLLSSESLATALMFAIRRETLTFLRGATNAEFAAAERLHAHLDTDLLRNLAHPAISESTVDAISDAIDNRTVRGSTLLSHTGWTTERDAIPQAADYLSEVEGVETCIVFGLIDDAVELSARSTDSRVHIGQVLDAAFSDVGSAGGHRQMAGGQIPLGLFADLAGDEDDDDLVEMVETIVSKRLTRQLNLSTRENEGKE
ncbi:bifunctional oligoribonuclease/PAP phosphatase NrnA [Salinigranum rubrum]|uniref:Bifunctional oligoribonuclease/PAP phosphatase NrnA n=1 Tax=Salinigranum rubrum TaxID=755307 RepID=A0A2I8VGQ9_9EURY|nr:bifunctional oligoribonuclease/PAP phosphatase NrnA [Salinigranum rubrum]AUV81074.1 bifunctional oligoribonuclease/PAP phosphatase NrnA [Salinigranum rubrum]